MHQWTFNPLISSIYSLLSTLAIHNRVDHINGPHSVCRKHCSWGHGHLQHALPLFISIRVASHLFTYGLPHRLSSKKNPAPASSSSSSSSPLNGHFPLSSLQALTGVAYDLFQRPPVRGWIRSPLRHDIDFRYLITTQGDAAGAFSWSIMTTM